MRFIKLIISGLLSIYLCDVYATHLMGGNIQYEYLGKNTVTNKYEYAIKMYVYQDCNSPYWGTSFPEQTATLDVYEGPADFSSTLNYQTSFTLSLTASNPVNLDLPAGCSVNQTACIYETIYEGVIELDNSFKGYHLFYANCCRNNSIINLNNPGDQGMVYSAYIPPPLVENNSPIFQDVPLPFLCVNDTTTILNTAYDPDGDLLVFSLVDPYDAYTSISSSSSPPPTLDSIYTVTFASGYNYLKPFGNSGYVYINAFTGYSQYMSPTVGNFVVSVEIKEYRNGNLIGVSRRDIQLLITDCPTTNTYNPELNSSTPTTYNIEEGEQLCFDIVFNDNNGDSIYLSTNSSLFDPSIVNPPATINTPVGGLGTATANFCWNTACGQGRTQPYTFDIKAIDNGCAPKNGDMTFQIYVAPFSGPSVISGQDVACSSASNLTYSTDNILGATYNWSINGGSIASGNGTNSVTVNWGNGPLGELTVTVTSQFGCTAPAINKLVNITTIPISVSNDTTICQGDTVQLEVNPAGYNYAWSPDTNISNINAKNPLVWPDITTQYIVTVSDGSGCSTSDTVTINVLTTNIILTSDTSICSGDTIQLEATGGSAYIWSPASSLDNPNIYNPQAYPDTTTIYYVTVSGGSGCNNTDSVIIDVNAVPFANAGNDTIICAGQSVVLGGTPTGPPGFNYLWTPATGLDDPTISNPTATSSITTQYIVSVYANGCSSTDTVIVNLFDLPLADAGTDTTICFGTSVTLNASGGIAYEWNNPSSLSNITVSNPVASPTDTTSYIVTVTDANSCKNTDTITVYVLPLPNVSAGADVWLCPSDSITLNASGAVSYSWLPLTNIINENTASPTVFPPDTFDYYVYGTDIYGCVNSDTITIIVNPVVPTEAGNNQTICLGDSVQIGGNPTAPPGTAFNWMPSTGLDDASNSNPVAAPSDTTLYYVETLNHICNGRDSVYVFVNPLPAANAGNDMEICIGDSAVLVASGGNTYVWEPNINISVLNNDTTIVFPTDTISYYVTATDNNGCSNIDSIKINVNPLPLVNAGIDKNICAGDTVQITATGANNYAWSPNTYISDTTINAPFVYPVSNQSYIVQGIDSNNCVNYDTIQVFVFSLPNISISNDTAICLGDTITLYASGGTDYFWQPNYNIDNITISTPNIFPASNTIYSVTVTDSNNCSASDSIAVSVYLLPAIDAGINTQICFGDTTQLQASGGVSYVWHPNIGLSDTSISNPLAFPLDTITYYVTGIDNNTCKNTDSVTVIVNPLPLVNAGGYLQTCEGDTVILGGNPTAPAGSSYIWQPTNNLLTTNTIANPVAVIDTTIQYQVWVTDTNGCFNADSILIETFEIARIEDIAICDNEIGTLQVEIISGASPYTYHWSPAIGLSDTASSMVNVTLTENQSYTVTVTDNNNCKRVLPDISVLVSESPVPKFSRSYTPACSGLHFELRNQSEKTDYHYWLMPDNSIYERNLLLMKVPYNSTESVYLVTENIYGCKDSLEIPFIVDNFEDYVSLTSKNVFTPNGDGVNDFFEIHNGTPLGDCSILKIYNRWGTLLFETSGNNASWNGTTFDGQPVPNGTYFYIVEIKNYTFKGSLTLIR